MFLCYTDEVGWPSVHESARRCLTKALTYSFPGYRKHGRQEWKLSLTPQKALSKEYFCHETSSSELLFIIQSLSHVRLFVTPWTAASQASASFPVSWSLLKLMSIESMMPSKHFIHCWPLFLLPSVLPSIRVFSKESVLHIRWSQYWSFSFSISPSSEYSRLILEYSEYSGPKIRVDFKWKERFLRSFEVCGLDLGTLKERNVKTGS